MLSSCNEEDTSVIACDNSEVERDFLAEDKSLFHYVQQSFLQSNCWPFLFVERGK